jgi:hypothetical protein
MAVLLTIAGILVSVIVLVLLWAAVYGCCFCVIGLLGWTTGLWNVRQSAEIAQGITELLGEVLGIIAEGIGTIVSGLG